MSPAVARVFRIERKHGDPRRPEIGQQPIAIRPGLRCGACHNAVSKTGDAGKRSPVRAAIAPQAVPVSAERGG